MKKIPLTQGKFALVDDEDFEWLSQWKWKLHKDGYAVRTGYKNSRFIQIYMHREVNKTPLGILTDHINRNRLDNRRINLRNVNYSQNAFNTGLWKHNTSGIKGVFWNAQKKKWHAVLSVNKKQVHLGFFDEIEKAILARKEGEKQYV